MSKFQIICKYYPIPILATSQPAPWDSIALQGQPWSESRSFPWPPASLRYFLPFSSLFTSPSLSISLLYSNSPNGSPRPFTPTLYHVNNSTEPTKVSQLRSTNVAWKREDEKQTMKLPLSLDAGILIILAGDLETLQSLLFIALLPVKKQNNTLYHSARHSWKILHFIFCHSTRIFPLYSRRWVPFHSF